jgi:uncharacterized protein (TIGR02145 family)
MKKLTQYLVVIALITLITNCNKKDDGPSVEPVQISLPDNQLKAFELALIEVNTNLEQQAQLFDGAIESESVVFKSNGNYLIFRVPTGAAGTKNGSVSINGEDFNFQYTLEANSFTNPEIYLQDYFAEQQTQEAELISLQSDFIEDSIPGFEDIQTDLAIWDQIAINAQAELAALSVEDKERLAQLLDANSEWIDRLDDALLMRSIYSDLKMTKDECRALIDEGRLESQEGKLFSAAATAVKAYWCSLTFEERQYEDVDNDFERGTLLITDLEFSPSFDVHNTLINLVFRKADGLIKELQGSISSNGVADEIYDIEYKMASEIPFGNGDPTPIFAKIRFRSVNENDVNTSGAAGNAATFFNQLMASYTEMLTATNKPLIWRPGFTQTSVTKDFNQFLTVPSESVSNSDVILVNTQYVDDTWELVFGNDGSEQEPTFSFELNYDDGYVQLQKTVSAKIVEGCANPNPCNGQTSISWGGHTYPLVEIGCQCWFAENLRYSGSIPQVSGDANWAAIHNNGNPTGQAAWCYYDDNNANDAIYGKLYNWYAVNTGGLCPSGWHIPTDAEWTILTDYLGGEAGAGGKMKSTSGLWAALNTDATNSSGFSGLPGGSRGSNGPFNNIGNYGYWWSSTEFNANNARSRSLSYGNGNVYRYNYNKIYGFSCRCLRD